MGSTPFSLSNYDWKHWLIHVAQIVVAALLVQFAPQLANIHISYAWHGIDLSIVLTGLVYVAIDLARRFATNTTPPPAA